MDGSDLARRVLEACKSNGLMAATAESCTGGMVAAALTDVAGSSAVVDRGFVTYSNEAKADMLGVPKALIEAHGAVSEPVARAMAEGALRHSQAQIAVSITGIAGPGGGSVEKPEGLVHFARASRGGVTIAVKKEFGPLGRAEVRRLSVHQALQMLLDSAEDKHGTDGS